MNSQRTPGLPHGYALDGIIGSDAGENAVTFISAQPNMGVMSGGNEIQFRGGRLTTSDEAVIEVLRTFAKRNPTVQEVVEDAPAAVAAAQAADAKSEVKQVAAAVVAQGQAAASTVKA